MRYLKLGGEERESLLSSLREMPDWIGGVVAGLSAAGSRVGETC